MGRAHEQHSPLYLPHASAPCCLCAPRSLQAGMEPWDVHMSDLLSGAVSLDAFQGIVFVGGFRWGGLNSLLVP